ncbi:iron-sulfur cluster assembly scaffold protein [Novosphingobium rosa]|uniref:iron-sulfur cluster assembly scaffold protein n=1 Tax=Novosphingobium rosa TaxID=76978 RepID=UPI000AFC9650|nr:iron-sulfur cluster assembly scaffold protein [Novosphingobium rosa]
MASGSVLYSPDVLAMALDLARWPMAGDLPLIGEARSASCGSRMRVGIELNEQGAISRIGVAAQACAIGQAAASLMARAAQGRNQQDFAKTEAEIVAWLGGDDALPDWPGLEALAAVRDYPGRHGAFLLGWRAVLQAMATQDLRAPRADV